MGVQLVHVREALPVLPEEGDEPQLCEDAHDVGGALLCNQDPVHSAAEDLDGFCQVCCFRQCDQRLLPVAHLLDVPQWYRLSLPTLLGELVKGGDVLLVGVRKADNQEEVCVEVAVVERARGVPRVLVFAQQDNIGGAALYQCLRVSAEATPDHVSMLLTTVASSTLVSYSAKRTKLGSTISPSRIVFQSRPWNWASPPFVGGLFSSSCRACCVRLGWREARGDPGVPRICSAKLPRWARGSGLDAILRAAGGGERPMEAVELLRDCSGDGMWPSFLRVSAFSAMAGAIQQSAGCCRRCRVLELDVCSFHCFAEQMDRGNEDGLYCSYAVDHWQQCWCPRCGGGVVREEELCPSTHRFSPTGVGDAPLALHPTAEETIPASIAVRKASQSLYMHRAVLSRGK